MFVSNLLFSGPEGDIYLDLFSNPPREFTKVRGARIRHNEGQVAEVEEDMGEIDRCHYCESKYYGLQQSDDDDDESSSEVSRILRGLTDFSNIRDINWKSVAENTGSVKYLGEPISVVEYEHCMACDVNGIFRDALEGNPYAQYTMAEIYWSRLLPSDSKTRKNLERGMAMFLLIAAREGGYEDAKERILHYFPLLPDVDFTDEKSISEYVEAYVKRYRTQL